VVGARRFLVSARPPVIEPDHQSSCSSAKEPIAAVTVASQTGPFAFRLYVVVCTWCRWFRHVLSRRASVSEFSASDDSRDSRLAVSEQTSGPIKASVCASAGSAPAGELVTCRVFHE
jgi:hypothetical protein